MYGRRFGIEKVEQCRCILAISVAMLASKSSPASYPSPHPPDFPASTVRPSTAHLGPLQFHYTQTFESHSKLSRFRPSKYAAEDSTLTMGRVLAIATALRHCRLIVICDSHLGINVVNAHQIEHLQHIQASLCPPPTMTEGACAPTPCPRLWTTLLNPDSCTNRRRGELMKIHRYRKTNTNPPNLTKKLL